MNRPIHRIVHEEFACQGVDGCMPVNVVTSCPDPITKKSIVIKWSIWGPMEETMFDHVIMVGKFLDPSIFPEQFTFCLCLN